MYFLSFLIRISSDRRFFRDFFLLGVLFPAHLFSAESETIWKMEDGVVTVEIESVVEGGVQSGHWEKVSGITGYSGSTALIFNGDGNMYRDPLVYDAPKPANRLSYQIWVDEPGEYIVKIRNYHQQEDGDNDIWFSYNKTIYQKLWDHDAKQWTWSEARSYIGNYQPFPLHKGINRIDIVGRSRGFTLDKMVIFKAGTPKNKWSTREESPLLESRVPDNSPPTVPANLVVTGVSTGTIGLSWSASADDHFVYGYEIYINSEYVTTVHETYYTVPSLEMDTRYTFTVRGRDIAGNLSDRSHAVRPKTEKYNTDQGTAFVLTGNPPSVDGKMDDVWNEAPRLIIASQIAGVIEPEGDLAGEVRALWDENNLYLLASVEDDHPSTEAGKHDGVEFYLDPDNSKEQYWKISDRIYQFSLSRPKQDGEFHVTTAKIQRDKYLEGLQEERIILNNGYRIEIAVPWKTLGIEPESGMILGFDVIANDYDEESGGLEGASAWHGATKYAGESPARLGSVMLTGNAEY